MASRSTRSVNNEYVTIQQAAQLVSVNERTIRRLIKKGQLAYGRLGENGAIRIKRAALDSLLGQSTYVAPPAGLDDFIESQIGGAA